MDPKSMEIGSLWLDIQGKMFFIPLGDDQYMCWYVDGHSSLQRNYSPRKEKVLFENLDETFWVVQRPERFERIA